MTCRIRFACLLGLALLSCMSGCGDSLPTTIPVGGQVSFRGEPLSDGVVTFHPQEVAAGLPRRPATGRLDEQGRFQLTTFRQGDGALPGTYQVTVHSYEHQPEYIDDVAPTTPNWRIPQSYGDPLSSGLTALVREEMGSIVFELTE